MSANIQLHEKLIHGIYKRSALPTDDANRLDADWQAGYLLGYLTENKADFASNTHDITVEWIRLGQPASADTPAGKRYSNWKVGYNTGKLKRVCEQRINQKA